MTEPFVGIEPHFLGKVTSVKHMSRPTIVARQCKPDTISGVDFRVVKIIGIARHHLGASRNSLIRIFQLIDLQLRSGAQHHLHQSLWPRPNSSPWDRTSTPDT